MVVAKLWSPLANACKLGTESGISTLRWIWMSLDHVPKLTLILLCSVSFAADFAHGSEIENDSVERVALVVGNAAYQSGALRNPLNDAADVSAKLRGLHFKVIEGQNLDREAMVRKVQEFRAALSPGGVALFFYSGHGVEVDGLNYLVPINNGTIRTIQDVELYGLDAHRLVGQMEASGTYLNIVILDACRDNPLPSVVRSANRGLIPMEAEQGTLIAYSTRRGHVAADGAGRNSPYTEALLRFLDEPGMEISQMFNRVGLQVATATLGVQVPWVSSSPVPAVMLAGPGFGTPMLKEQTTVAAPIIVPAAPVSSPIIIRTRSNGISIDNSKAGPVFGYSNITLRIPSAKFEYLYWLDDPWEDQSLALPDGRYEFEIEPSIEVRAGTIENSCRGFIDVHGPTTFRWWIKLNRLSLAECELSPAR